MRWNSTPYFLPLLGATALCVVLALAIWRRSGAPGRAAATALLAAVAVWALSYGFEIQGADLATKVLAAKLQYLGIVAAPVCWLVFVVQYTGHSRWITPLRLLLLATLPLITVLLVWTNEGHGLVWSALRLDATGPFPALVVEHGPWFWAHLVYSYLLLLAGTLLLFWAFLRAPGVYRAQAGALLGAAVAPWVGNALYLAGLSPVRHLDLTPYGFVVSGALIAWSLLRLRLLDLVLGIVPIARAAIVESMPDGYLVLDRSGQIVDLNPAALQILGRSRRAVVGQPLGAVAPDWARALEAADEKAGRRLEVSVGTVPDRRTYELMVSPLWLAGGFLVGRLLVLRDVTERKRVEAERAELLAREQAARAEAEQAVRVRDQFLTVAAHELKTPVAIVRGYAQLLRRSRGGERPAAESRALEVIERSCDRLVRRVEDLLTFSRLAGGRLEFARERFDLGRLAAEVVEQLAATTPTHRFQLEREGEALAEGDPDRAEQVLVNLLSNAIKFSPEGSAIETRVAVQGDEVVVSVRDEGVGIPVERQGQIFERFYQAHVGTEYDAGGLGIGLYLSRELVIRQGGRIWFTSAEGRGSTFAFSLPRAGASTETA